MKRLVQFFIECTIQLFAMLLMLTAWDCWPSGRGLPRFMAGVFALVVYTAVERSQERRKSNPGIPPDRRGAMKEHSVLNALGSYAPPPTVLPPPPPVRRNALFSGKLNHDISIGEMIDADDEARIGLLGRDPEIQFVRLAAEYRKLCDRERQCKTMREAEARALVRALKEIGEAAGMLETASPRQIVERVRKIVAENGALHRQPESQEE